MAIPGTPRWTATPSPGLQINSVAITPDGALSLCGTSNEFGTGQFSLCCYRADGTLAWQQPVTAANATQGVFWVALSADGRLAAGGGESAPNVGFLTICDAATGRVLHTVQQGLPGRVNQLTFSDDGTLLLAAYSNALQLYRIQPDGTVALRSTATFEPHFNCLSAVIAGSGQFVWAGAIDYRTTPSSGLVECLEIRGGLFSTVARCPMAAGVMRVASTSDGAFAAAALHTGSCALVSAAQADVPFWTYTPPEQNLSLAYAVDVTCTDAGHIVIACGANQSVGNAGFLYVVDSQPLLSPTMPTRWTPVRRWIATLQYAANPGVRLDRNATLVTATDGKPGSSQVRGTPESPGNFYLFDATTGTREWQVPTPLMNWPMVITPDGSAVLGGSDDGSVYYWCA